MAWAVLAPAATAAFLASLVEFVEALTIVLAVGVVRGWRPALRGALLASACLVILVALFWPLLRLVPLQALQLTVGVLLLLFGLRWLRKAILRGAGVIALHDEEKAFAKETAELRGQGSDAASWAAALTAFKAVFLEGLEVVFIVVAVGSRPGLMPAACVGAAAAFLLVAAVGLLVHRPLSRVPENTLKFLVGVMLGAFGVFWTGEGIGVEWPGGDLSIVAFAAAFLVVGVVTTGLLRRPVAEARA